MRCVSAELNCPKRSDARAAITIPAATASPCNQLPYPISASMAWPKVCQDSVKHVSPLHARRRQQLRLSARNNDEYSTPSPGRPDATAHPDYPQAGKEVRVEYNAVFDHLCQSRCQFACGKRFQAIKIDNHRSGLVKRANHVFAKGMVDGGLPAHGRINLRQ